jgi:serine phosphatase RsbU (regulator of sigma subunit)
MMLGMIEQPDFDPLRFELRPGQSLAMLTDGILEAPSADGVMFDDHRIDTALAVPGAAADIRDNLTAAFTAFTQGAVTNDDQAALIITIDPLLG